MEMVRSSGTDSLIQRVIVPVPAIHEFSSHDFKSYEIDANKRAYNYFKNQKGFTWNTYKYPLFDYIQYNPGNIVIK